MSLSYYLGFIIALGVCTVVLVFYRIYFHPLHAYPGPRLAAVSYLYHFYFDMISKGGGEIVNHLEELHAIYGPVVRIGPNELHFSEARAYMDMYRMGTGLTKEPWFYRMQCMEQSSFGFINPHDHKTRREMLSPLFSRRGILQLQHVIRDEVVHLVTAMGRTPEAPVDLHFAFRAIALEIVTSYFFGKHIGSLSSPGFRHQLLVDLQDIIFSFWALKWFPIMPIFSRLPDCVAVALNPKFRSNLLVRDMLAEQIAIFLKDNDALKQVDHEIIYTYLLSPQNEKHTRPSRRSLMDEAQVIVQAGSDTVGNTLCVGLLHALDSPHIHNALRAELDVAWPNTDEPMLLQQYEELPYLTAFIKESLRMSHGVLSPLPRIVNQDMVIGGHAVPAGTVVSSGSSFVHYDGDTFENPKSFKPERWMSEGASQLESSLVPFGRGPRQCIGMNLAWAELYIIFGNLFRRLDFELYDTSMEDFGKIKDYFVPVHAGRNPQALVKPRTV
ncbi:cytochrome P450 [Cylindrobasidium torrendii FP15055 ss-10]|uniref:Cytochrome P450 n=1 Tax=Cylindrobasidium torrendii FP15055 ss-10 TaxID=1314674 RepID=A0A0D7BQN1_9AGAR|nr:cytochrome P450 [Cylindrobasidium torrendii FP15055 ss-10]